MDTPMDCLELAGLIIMENGGEIYRVQETVTRMALAFGLERPQAFAVPSGVLISYIAPDGERKTSVLRAHSRGTNLTRVNEVNAISRRTEANHSDPESVYADLVQIRDRRPLITPELMVPAAAVSAGAFAAMFGGGILDVTFAAVIAALIQALTLRPFRMSSNGLAFTLLGSFLASLLPLLLKMAGTGCMADAITAGALMPLLPGIAMTNAVRDTMRGDMISGTSHLGQAVLTAAMIAGGALAGSALAATLGGIL